AGEAVADDQLALATPDGDHRVDRLDPGLHRAVDALAGDDAWSDALERQGLGGLDRALAVDGLTERVDDAADELVADRHLDQAAAQLLQPGGDGGVDQAISVLQPQAAEHAWVDLRAKRDLLPEPLAELLCDVVLLGARQLYRRGHHRAHAPGGIVGEVGELL